MRKALIKAARHVRWARSEGLSRLVEEDQLDPRARLRTAWVKARWRRTARRSPGLAVPLFVVGLQRSGTNMLVRGFDAAPEVEVHNENDRRAFRDFRLRSDETVHRLIRQSRHDYILFKPLCDSHRTAELLDALDRSSPGKAIWVYRQVDGRVRSSVAKFGDSNLRALRAIATGHGGDRWEAGGLEEEDVELLRRQPLDRFNPETGSALFWYLRNNAMYRSGLHERADVTVVSYEDFLRDPERTMVALCDRIGFPYRADLIAGIRAQSTTCSPSLDIERDVKALCQDLQDRLDAASRAQLRID